MGEERCGSLHVPSVLDTARHASVQRREYEQGIKRCTGRGVEAREPKLRKRFDLDGQLRLPRRELLP